VKLLCDKCKGEFVPSRDQLERIVSSKDRGMVFIMLTCPLCDRSFAINPISTQAPDMPTRQIGDGLRCPHKTCCGIIAYVEDSPSFWGCGECGSTWFNKDDLFRDIDNISKQYVYRRKVYIKDKNFHFLPVDLAKEPKNYEKLVEKERNETY
jgi:hypothetical protein